MQDKHALNADRLTSLEAYFRDLLADDRLPALLERPLSCQLELTQRCNLLCEHCYNRSGEKPHSAEFTADQWVSIAETVAGELDPFQVIISGGEPLLLGSRVFDVMDPFHRRGAAFVFITNGWLVTSEVVARLGDYRHFWIQVSIDGPSAQIHDTIRARPGSWDRAKRAATLICDARLPLEIATVVTPEWLDRLEEMVRLALDCGGHRLVLTRTMPAGRGLFNFDRLGLTPEQDEFLDRDIVRLRTAYEGQIDIRPSVSYHFQLGRYSILPAGGFIIRPDGELRLDCLAPFTFGNLREESVGVLWQRVGRRAWQHPNVQEYVKAIRYERDILGLSPRNHIDPDVRIDFTKE